jgi:hypothetical protein
LCGYPPKYRQPQAIGRASIQQITSKRRLLLESHGYLSPSHTQHRPSLLISSLSLQWGSRSCDLNLDAWDALAGTGKTTSLVEVILAEAAAGHRVLYCAASNIAVDNTVERLAKAAPAKVRARLVRVGHPARLLPEVLEHSLEAAVCLCPARNFRSVL